MYRNFNGSVVYIFLQLLQNALQNICFKLHKNLFYYGALKARQSGGQNFPKQQIWLGVIITFLYSEFQFFGLFCICIFVFAVGKDKKGILSIKIMCQTNSGVNQNEKRNILYFYHLKKKWESANTENIKFIIHTRFSSFLCLYNCGTVKGFTDQYIWNYE